MENGTPRSGVPLLLFAVLVAVLAVVLIVILVGILVSVLILVLVGLVSVLVIHFGFLPNCSWRNAAMLVCSKS